MQSKCVLYLATLLLVGFVCLGCVSTTLVYSPNVYHTGRISGGDRLKIRGSVEAAPKFISGPSGSNLSTHANSDEQSLLLALGLHKAFSEYSDFGAEVAVASGVSTRVYLQTQLTPFDDDFAASVMPALIYIGGSHQTDSNTGENLRSEAYGVELHLPMSYALSKQFDITWAPKAAYLHYDAPYKNNPPQEADLPASMTRKLDLGCVGFAAGFRWSIFQPEASVLIALNPPDRPGDKLTSPLYTFGIAVHR